MLLLSKMITTTADPARASILLVDDDDDLRELYGLVLRRKGYVVREAENGAMALALLESMDKKPCVLVLDIMMPVMDGPELLKVLHSSGRLANLSVIVLSATGKPSDVPEANRFIRKPVDARVLASFVREFCGSSALPT